MWHLGKREALLRQTPGKCEQSGGLQNPGRRLIGGLVRDTDWTQGDVLLRGLLQQRPPEELQGG